MPGTKLKRYQTALAKTLVKPVFRPAQALRETLTEGYGKEALRADLMAGIVVGIIALPLSMALAISVGVPPRHGLYTAIVAGVVIALLGGSRVQVSGPTAAFVVILIPVVSKFGLNGLLVATVMGGVLQMLLGLMRTGQMIQYIPYTVTTGFTAGIAIVIATMQLKDFLGLTVGPLPEHYLPRLWALVQALPTARWPDLIMGAVTLAGLILFPRVTKKIPAPVAVLGAVTVAAMVLPHMDPVLSVSTVKSRFAAQGGIPQSPPMPCLPWACVAGQGHDVPLDWAMLRHLLGPAFAIAMLGAIESLLSAVVSDGMTGRHHDPDAELFAQGVGNVVAPFFGGFAATGALARTATNVRAGARSPMACVFHALVVLVFMVALAPWLEWMPMASLAALLLVVAWNMSEARHLWHVILVAPISDVVVMATCLVLTVVFDMVVAVSVGVVLASLLFMRRMADVANVTLYKEKDPHLTEPLPPGVLHYVIAGPLFFGAAHKAMGELEIIHAGTRVVILDLRAVPMMDATGLVNLESALLRLAQNRVKVILAGVGEPLQKTLALADIQPVPGRLAIVATLEEALDRVRRHLPPEPLMPGAV